MFDGSSRCPRLCESQIRIVLYDRKILAQAVVQLGSKALAFLFLRIQQLSGEFFARTQLPLLGFPQRLFGLLPLSYVHIHANKAELAIPSANAEKGRQTKTSAAVAPSKLELGRRNRLASE